MKNRDMKKQGMIRKIVKSRKENNDLKRQIEMIRLLRENNSPVIGPI